jgi:hypothetical protein
VNALSMMQARLIDHLGSIQRSIAVTLNQLVAKASTRVVYIDHTYSNSLEYLGVSWKVDKTQLIDLPRPRQPSQGSNILDMH